MLKIPMGSKNIPSIPIQLANSRCDPPHVGTTEQENIIQYTIWTFDGKHHAKCWRYNQQWTMDCHGPLFFCWSLGWWSLLRVAQWSSISNRSLLLLMSHAVGSVSWGLGGKAVWNHWAMHVEPRAMAAFHMVRSVHLQPTWPTGIIGCDCVYNMEHLWTLVMVLTLTVGHDVKAIQIQNIMSGKCRGDSRPQDRLSPWWNLTEIKPGIYWLFRSGNYKALL